MFSNSQNLENYIKELKRVFYLISSMQNSTDLKQMLNLMLKECVAITKATSGSIMFKHKQSDRLFFYADQGIDQEVMDNTCMNVGDGIAGTVIEEGVPKIINDISLDPKYITINNAIQSEMAVPIKIHSKVLGVIVLDHVDTDIFTDKHLELVQMICSNTGFIISYFIENLIAQKNEKLLGSMLTISNITSPKDIFTILTKELNADSACIINDKGEVLFQEGKMVEEVILSPKLFEASHSEILITENSQKIPYTRIVIPRIQGDMTFIADKIYYFTDNALLDINFADKILEFLATKDSKFHHDETLSQWAERKMVEQPGQVYNIAVGSIEKEIIIAALKKNKDNRLKTSQFLGINRNTLRHKMEIYGLEK